MLAQNELSHKTPVKDKQALTHNAEVSAEHNFKNFLFLIMEQSNTATPSFT